MRRRELAVFLDRLDHLHLLAVQELIAQPERQGLEVLVVIQVAVGLRIRRTVQDKFQQSRHDRLAALGDEEVLQMVVRQRRIFYVDLADNAYLDLELFAPWDGGEVLQNLSIDLLCGKILAALEQFRQLFLPGIQHLLGLALVQLIGTTLVEQGHEHIGIQHGVHHLDAQRRRQLQTGVFFQSGEVQRDHRHVGELFRHALPEQVDIVGRTASAAGLGDEQRRMVYVILAAFQRLHKLSHHQQRRIAGVVMYVFQSLFHDRAGSRLQQHHMIPELFQDADQQMEVNGEHIGCKNGICLFHFRCKLCVCHRYGYLLGMLWVLGGMQFCAAVSC